MEWVIAVVVLIIIPLAVLAASGKKTVEGSRDHYWGHNSGRDTIRERESRYWNKKS